MNNSSSVDLNLYAAGEYHESLPRGAKLVVRACGWHIEYYFSGPDMRYNGTWVRIEDADVLEYKMAFQRNWLKYIELKNQIPEGGSFSIVGECRMTINIGGYWDGVCIRDHYGALSEWKDIEEVMAAYEYAAQRAEQIQGMLQQLVPIGGTNVI